MSGEYVDTLIGSGLHTPSGLTIDYNMNGRLFWTDSYLGHIESCNFDGTDRTQIIATQGLSTNSGQFSFSK
jgi:Low-density lipoprotein receptor repeat class B